MRLPPCRVTHVRAVALVAAAIALAATGTGCQTTTSPPQSDLPSLRDIRRKDTIPPEVAHTLDAQPVRRTPLLVERLDFPLDAPLHQAWSFLDTSGLSPATAGAWRVNGMRAGVFRLAKRSEFLNRLPEAGGGKSQIVVPATLPLPLVQSPVLEGAVSVDLTVPPRPVREVALQPGGGAKVQLLVEVQRDPMGRPFLLLTPHYFVPQVSLAVRSAEEKQLDGHMLHDLTLALRLAPDEVLVLGLEVPLVPRFSPPPDDPRPATPPAGVQQAQPRDPTLPVDPSSPPPPVELELEDQLGPHLGRALFAATRYRKSIQMMYLVRLAE